MLYCGIDYSMNHPAVCLFRDNKWEICYLTAKKKYQKFWSSGAFIFSGMPYPTYNTEIERFYKIASWTLNRIVGAEHVYLEDYAMGAKGATFTIGEHTGILKYLLWENKITITTVAPTKVKKFATGKGNAKKDIMYESWMDTVGIDLLDRLGMQSIISPLTDIVDSYYICKMHVSSCSH
jgi:Holliday junction resolvasome RuvABC endonuclease subunit